MSVERWEVITIEGEERRNYVVIAHPDAKARAERLASKLRSRGLGTEVRPYHGPPTLFERTA